MTFLTKWHNLTSLCCTPLFYQFQICQFLQRAAAPEIISISSPVITACLVLLYVSVNLSIISPEIYRYDHKNCSFIYTYKIIQQWPTIINPADILKIDNLAQLQIFALKIFQISFVYYGGKWVSEHFRITHNSIVLSPQTIKMVVISPRIIQTK